MDKKFFNCKVRFQKMAENGTSKTVTESYLVDALSYTEAESSFIEYITPYMNGDFEVVGINRYHLSEIFTSDEESADKWYRAKIYFITLDEKSGLEKRTSTFMLVQAADLRDAVKKLDEGMKGTMADYEIASMAETNIMDVVFYEHNVKEVKHYD